MIYSTMYRIYQRLLSMTIPKQYAYIEYYDEDAEEYRKLRLNIY